MAAAPVAARVAGARTEPGAALALVAAAEAGLAQSRRCARSAHLAQTRAPAVCSAERRRIGTLAAARCPKMTATGAACPRAAPAPSATAAVTTTVRTTTTTSPRASQTLKGSMCSGPCGTSKPASRCGVVFDLNNQQRRVGLPGAADCPHEDGGQRVPDRQNWRSIRRSRRMPAPGSCSCRRHRQCHRPLR